MRLLKMIIRAEPRLEVWMYEHKGTLISKLSEDEWL